MESKVFIFCLAALVGFTCSLESGPGLQVVTIKCNIVYEDIYLTAVYLGKPIEGMTMQYQNKSIANDTFHTFEKCTQSSNDITSSITCKTMNINDENLYALRVSDGKGATSNMTGGFKPSQYKKQCISGQPKVVLVKIEALYSESFVASAKVSQDAYFTTPIKAVMTVINKKTLEKQTEPCILSKDKIATCLSSKLLPSTKYQACVTEDMKFSQTYTTCVDVETLPGTTTTEEPTPVPELPKSLKVQAVACAMKKSVIYLTAYFSTTGEVEYTDVKMTLQQSLSSWFPMGDGDVIELAGCFYTESPLMYSVTCRTKSIFDMNQYKISLVYEELSDIVENNFRPSTYSNMCLKKAPATTLSVDKSKTSPSALTVSGTTKKPIPPKTLMATTYTASGTKVSKSYCSMTGPSQFQCVSREVDPCGSYKTCVQAVGYPGSSSCIKSTTPGCVNVVGATTTISYPKNDSYWQYGAGFGGFFGFLILIVAVIMWRKHRQFRLAESGNRHQSSYENLATVGVYDPNEQRVTVSLLKK